MIKSANLTTSVSRKAGGLFDAILRQVQSHDRQKMDARVFGLRDEFTDADQQAWSPVPMTAFDPVGPKMLGYSPCFREELLAFEPHLVHTHGLWLYPSIATTAYSQKLKRPYLISPHGMLDPWALKNSRWKKRIAWALFEQSHQGRRDSPQKQRDVACRIAAAQKLLCAFDLFRLRAVHGPRVLRAAEFSP